MAETDIDVVSEIVSQLTTLGFDDLNYACWLLNNREKVGNNIVDGPTRPASKATEDFIVEIYDKVGKLNPLSRVLVCFTSIKLLQAK